MSQKIIDQQDVVGRFCTGAIKTESDTSQLEPMHNLRPTFMLSH